VTIKPVPNAGNLPGAGDQGYQLQQTAAMKQDLRTRKY